MEGGVKEAGPLRCLYLAPFFCDLATWQSGTDSTVTLQEYKSL